MNAHRNPNSKLPPETLRAINFLSVEYDLSIDLASIVVMNAVSQVGGGFAMSLTQRQIEKHMPAEQAKEVIEMISKITERNIGYGVELCVRAGSLQGKDQDKMTSATRAAHELAMGLFDRELEPLLKERTKP